MAAGRGGRPSKGRVERVDLRLPPDLKEDLQRYCEERGLSMNDLLNEMIIAEMSGPRRPSQGRLDLGVTALSEQHASGTRRKKVA